MTANGSQLRVAQDASFGRARLPCTHGALAVFPCPPGRTTAQGAGCGVAGTGYSSEVSEEPEGAAGRRWRGSLFLSLYATLSPSRALLD